MTTAAFEPGIWVAALPLLLIAAACTWIVTLPLRNLSLADSLWSLLLFAAAVIYALDSDPRAPRLSLVLWLMAVWAARLAIYLAARNAGKGESWRYRALRERHGRSFALRSVLLVFAAQALLAWIVSLPLLGAFASIAPLGPLDALGAALWFAGFLLEAEADWQLARFRANPANADAVLRTGLWRYTRHPNYFGECCVWWGFWMMALSAGAWWSFPGPLLLTWLLLRVSGVPLLEGHLGNHRPQYADYVLKTNAFIPSRPRK